MSRDGSDIYSAPPGTAAVSGTPVGSSAYNTFIADLVNDLNTPRPVSMGGTGAATGPAALVSLGAMATDADIVAIAALGYSARSTLVKTAANTWSLVPQTTFGDTLLAAADAAAGRTALGLGTAAVVADSGLVHLAGSETISGTKSFSASINFTDSLEGVFLSGGGSLVDQTTTRTILAANGDKFDIVTENYGAFIASFTASGLTLGAGADPVVTRTSTDTLTNKTISGGSVVINNSANAIRWGHSNTDYYVQCFSNLGNGYAFLGFNMRQGTTSNTVRTDASNRGVGLRADNGAVTFTAANSLATDNQTPTDFFEVRGDVLDVRLTGTATALATTSVGYRGLGARNSQNGSSYTFVISDIYVVHDTASIATWTIPPNSSVAFPIGTVIRGLNAAGSLALTIAEGSGVTLRRGDGTAGTGSRTVAANAGFALEKTATNEWYISGVFT